MKYVLCPADKAQNVVVYVDTLTRELIGTYTYKLQASLSERVAVGGNACHAALNRGVKAMDNKTWFIRYTGYLHSLKPIKQDLLLILVFERQQKVLTSCLVVLSSMG